MPKIPRPPRTWLQPQDVKNGDILTILAEPIWTKENPFRSPTKRLVIPVVGHSRTEALFKWSLNATTHKNLYIAYGEDGANWVGKLVRVEPKTFNFYGRVVRTIFGYPHGEYNKPQRLLR